MSICRRNANTRRKKKCYTSELADPSVPSTSRPFLVPSDQSETTTLVNTSITTPTTSTTSTTRCQHGSYASVHRRIAQAAFWVHVVSLLACAAATASTVSNGSSSSPPCEFRFPAQSNRTDQCLVWSSSSPRDICKEHSGESRIRKLKSIFLFPELHPISLFEIFSAGGNGSPRRLRQGVLGYDCVHSGSNKCIACYERMSLSLRRLDEAYRSFNQTLYRFDCLPAVDTASATRPFSPNGSCDNCRTWYRRWLLAQTLDLWSNRPCVNWCYYAQLACPHLATSKVVDYAGHPSFQCRDMDIQAWADGGTDTAQCGCVHPCDLRGLVSSGVAAWTPSMRHDFYAARHHCEARRVQCQQRNTAHERRASGETDVVTNSASAATTPRLRQGLTAGAVAAVIMMALCLS